MPTTPPLPGLEIALGGRLTLSSPIVAASGCFGYGEEVAELADTSSLGALITPTITLVARAGSPMPRTAETSAGLLHALGWPNPGLEGFLRDRLPRLQALPFPALISIHGESPSEWREMAAALHAAGVSGFELNLSAVSLEGEAKILRGISAAVKSVRETTDRAVIAKLPSANVEMGAAARAAAEAGADAIAVSQGFPGVAVRLSSRAFRLPGVAGDLSGPCIKPQALYQVWRVSQSVAIPILGSGGIMTGDDAIEFLIAGATAVAIGIASSIRPSAIASIAADVAAYLIDKPRY